MTTKAKNTQQQPAEEEEDEVLELPERAHLEGCPMDPDDLEWEERVAVTGEFRGQNVEIIRCVRCGGQTVKQKEKD